MNINLGFNKNYNSFFLGLVIKAIKKYGMISQNQHIVVALSGGEDSISMLYILVYLSKYSFLKFKITAIHIKTANYDTNILKEYCMALNIEYVELNSHINYTILKKGHCYTCSKIKRGVLAKYMLNNNFEIMSFGHHANDVAETFFLNMLYHKTLGSFAPFVKNKLTKLIIIRPIIYLEKNTIKKIHSSLNLPILQYKCPYAETNIREFYRDKVKLLYPLFEEKNFSQKLAFSLENFDKDNNWEKGFSKKYER